MTKRRNLEGYEKRGKRFVPPMKQIPGVSEQSYVDDLLPELIWLGLIHDRMGYGFGAKVLQVAIGLIKQWSDLPKPANYALQAAYRGLTHVQKTEIVERWERSGLLKDIQYSLAPLVLLYDGFSLTFVGPPSTALSNVALTEQIKSCVGRHLDRFETPAIVLHGTLLMSRLIAGTIRFPQGMELPDLDAVIERPESDDAKSAAGFLRANAIGEFGMLGLDSEWPKYFWNRGAELSRCELPGFLTPND